VDGKGNAFVVGTSFNATFPTTAGAYRTAYGGGLSDAFVTKLNSEGSTLVYSTYLGGNGLEDANAIVVDNSGSAYVTGRTSSTNFPTTAGAYQATFGGGISNGFVSKLNPTGSALVYSTYLGGSDTDVGQGIAIDGSGNAYAMGITNSANFPTTARAFQTTFGGGSGIGDAFVSKLNAGGSGLVYSTYLGGSNQDFGAGIAVDNSGNAFITGSTLSADFPTTSGADQTTYGGRVDTFVSKLNAAGSGLAYSTYLGGSDVDIGAGIAVDSSGNVYVTGYTQSIGFPTTTGAFQTTFGGGSVDAFVSKFTFALPVTATPTPSSTPCPGACLTNTPTITRTVTSTATPTFTPTATSTPNATTRLDSIGIFRPSASTFYLRLYNSTGIADISVTFKPTTKPYPVVGDWTGAGYDTVGVFNQNTGQFSLRNSNTFGTPDAQFTFGSANDTPLSGKWLSSAAHFGVGVFRPSNGLIYLKNSLTDGFADYIMVLGIPGDKGLAGDWNGKNYDSPGVYRPSNITFYLTNQVCSCSVYSDDAFQYGVGGDAPVVGDWVGLGHDGVGLFRQTNGVTYLKNELTTGFADTTFVYGIAGDVPVAGHWQAVYPPRAGQATAPTNPGNVSPTSVPTPGGPGD
jgi:hypothetical protein